MENPALELDVISTSEKKENEKGTREAVTEPEATQSLVDTVDAAIKAGPHVKIVVTDEKGEDKLDGIRKKVALKPSPLLYGKKEVKKRDKALTLWGKVWRKLRYALPVLLIATMIIINQSIHKREAKQKNSNTQIDYQRLFQVLDKDTPLLKEWQKQDIVRKFYVFNWTNADQIGSFPMVKPQFQEVGPFFFDEVLKKIDLSYNTKENQLSFSLDRSKEFNRDTSLNDLEDIKVIVPYEVPTVASIAEILYGSLLSPLPYFYHQNITSERKGRFTVFTGNDNREVMNQLVDRPLDTLGDVWSTVSSPDFTHPLRIYSPDVCLTINFNDIQLTENGRQWASSCIEMESSGYDQTEKCTVVKRVNRCRGHSKPLSVSFPHFYTDKNYEYDEMYLQNVGGLKPDKKRHRPFARFELKTGKLLEKRMRLQYNVAYKLNNSRLSGAIPTEIMIPLFWFEEILIPERGLS